MTHTRALWLTCLLVSGCYQRPDSLDHSLGGAAARRVGSSLVYLMDNPAQAVLVDPTTDPASIRAEPFDCVRGASAAFGHQALAVVCWNEPPVLRVLSADQQGALKWSAWPLAATYNALSFSPDGRFLVLFHGPGTKSDGLFQNAGEFAVVDLDAAPSDSNPLIKTVDLRDRDPQSVTITPAFTHQGVQGRLALVASSSQLVAFNLLAPGDVEDVIPLKPSGALVEVWPATLRFLALPDGGLDAWLSATDATDVYRVQFRADAAGVDNDAPDFRSTTQLLTVGHMPADFLPFVDNGGTLRLLAVDAVTGTLVEFWPEAGTQKPFAMPFPYTRLTRVARPDGQDHFLLYGTAAWAADQGRTLADFDVAEADAKTADTFRVIELSDGVQGLLPVAGGPGFVVVHPTERLTLLDAVTRERTLIKGLGEPVTWALAGTRFHLVTSTGGGRVYGVLDVESGQASTVGVPWQCDALYVDQGDAAALLGQSQRTGGGVVTIREGSDGALEAQETVGFLVEAGL